MAQRLSQPQNINVLISDANWAWPEAVTKIFQPRGINALVADSTGDVLRLVTKNKIPLALLDVLFNNDLSGIEALKVIRHHDRLLPCILLAQQVDERLLAQALALDAFSVLAKPVDLAILAAQIDRLFRKYYASDIFAASDPSGAQKTKKRFLGVHSGKFTTVIKWTRRKHERSKDQDEDQTSCGQSPD